MDSLGGDYIGNLKGKPLRRFFKLLNIERKDITLVYTYAIIGGFVNLTLPLGIQAIMSLVQAGTASTSWYVIIGIVIVGIIFSGSLQIMQFSIIERLQQRIFARTSFEFAFRVPRMKFEEMLKEYAPELMNRFFDVLTIQKGLSKILVDFTQSFLQIIFSLVLLAFYHPFFVFYGLVILAIIIVVFYLTSPKGLSTSLDESKAKYAVAHWLEELARSMGIFKLAGYTDMPLDHTDNVVSKYVDARKKHFRVLQNQYIWVISFKVLVIAGMLIIGSVLVFNRQINIGQFVTSEIIIILILGSVDKLITTIETIYDVMTGLEKLGQVVDREIEGDQGMSFEDIDTGRGVSVKFENLSYQYPGTKHVALRNINMDIKSGEKVCIVGYNGAGTSTIINLVASLLHDYSGSILFNGITARNLNLISLRSFVGENMSNNEIMNGTIAENIGMGRDDISMSDIIEATEHAQVKDFIQGLPEGYDTRIIQDDMTVPDSVVVKINIARSIAENPRLFIMDQPLQGLSKGDQIKISNFLTAKEKDWTLIVSSNDGVLASMCDRIIVFKDGEIIDQGTFTELVRKPYFHDLIRS